MTIETLGSPSQDLSTPQLPLTLKDLHLLWPRSLHCFYSPLPTTHDKVSPLPSTAHGSPHASLSGQHGASPQQVSRFRSPWLSVSWRVAPSPTPQPQFSKWSAPNPRELTYALALGFLSTSGQGFFSNTKTRRPFRLAPASLSPSTASSSLLLLRDGGDSGDFITVSNTRKTCQAYSFHIFSGISRQFARHVQRLLRIAPKSEVCAQ